MKDALTGLLLALLVAMLSVETVGCFLSEPGSQSYPAPLGLLYPDRRDFIAFVGNPRWRSG